MTGPEAVERLVAAGFPRAAVEAVVRNLRQHGLWPTGNPGRRGRSSVHIEAHHITNVLLALAALMHVEGAATARALRELVEVRTVTTTQENGLLAPSGLFRQVSQPADGLGAQSLGDVLDRLIFHLAHFSPEQRAANEARWVRAERAKLTLDPTGAGSALLTQYVEDGVFEMVVYGPSQTVLEGAVLQAPPRVEQGHHYDLSLAAIFVAAEIVADALAHRGNTLFPAPDASATSGDQEDGNGASSAEATPETKNGADGAPARASTAPSNTTVQPRANGTTYAHTAENRERQRISQSLSSRGRLDTSPKTVSRRRRLGVSDHALAVP